MGKQKIYNNSKSRRELSSKELNAVKEVFARYSKNAGTISSQQASSAISELGMKPTDDELNKMVLAANVGEKRVFHLKNFVRYYEFTPNKYELTLKNEYSTTHSNTGTNGMCCEPSDSFVFRW